MKSRKGKRLRRNTMSAMAVLRRNRQEGDNTEDNSSSGLALDRTMELLTEPVSKRNGARPVRHTCSLDEKVVFHFRDRQRLTHVPTGCSSKTSQWIPSGLGLVLFVAQ